MNIYVEQNVTAQAEYGTRPQNYQKQRVVKVIALSRTSTKPHLKWKKVHVHMLIIANLNQLKVEGWVYFWLMLGWENDEKFKGLKLLDECDPEETNCF